MTIYSGTIFGMGLKIKHPLTWLWLWEVHACLFLNIDLPNCPHC